MKKIKLKFIDQYKHQVGADGQDIFVITSKDSERVDRMIGWLFENTQGRFQLLGTDTIYFELDNDAMHFMLAWGGQ